MGGWNFGKILPINVPTLNVGKFMFFDNKLSKSSEFYYLEHGIYPSDTDNVEAMNTLIQKEHNYSGSCITTKVSRTIEIDIYPLNEGYGLAFFSTDLVEIFGSPVGKVFGVILRRKGPPRPKFAYDIVRIRSLMIYTDLIEYNIVGNTQAPLLR